MGPIHAADDEEDRTLRSAEALLAAGLIQPAALPAVAATEARYAVALSTAMRALIRAPDDPIGRQFIPDPAELIVSPHESVDPIADDALSPVKGVVHRYADRALLKPLLVCPVYCRFCFRREHVGPDGGVLTDAELQAAYAWFAGHPEVTEIILTGGDPLMLSPRRLRAIIGALSAMPHIADGPFHSRVPVADPQRLTRHVGGGDGDGAVVVAGGARQPCAGIHSGAGAALRRVRALGIPVLGQSVLLRGVNDSAEALEALFRAMIAHRVKPYYLHQLDAAPGTARFHVPMEEGRALLESLRGRVTGLAWPTYVLDIPGGLGKVPIGPEYVRADGTVRAPGGAVRPDPVRRTEVLRQRIVRPADAGGIAAGLLVLFDGQKIPQKKRQTNRK